MATFNVTSVSERATLNAANRLVNVTVMHLETVFGNTGSLEIPTGNFEALAASEEGKATLREMLQAKADALDSPMSL